MTRRNRKGTARRKTVRPIPPHGPVDVVRPVPSLFFDKKAKRWRRPNGRFAKDPAKDFIKRTRISPGSRIFWDPVVKHYRDRRTKRFVSPDRKDLVIHRYAHKPKARKGGVKRWKVAFGGGLAYQRRTGKKKPTSFIETDVVGKFDTPDEVLAYMAAKSALFREMLETGAFPQVALVGNERGRERYVTRRVKLRVRYESQEIESG